MICLLISLTKDMLSDLNCIVVFVLTQNYLLAICSGAVQLLTLTQQLADGAWLPTACAESLAAGKVSEALQHISWTQKSVEAEHICFPLYISIYIYICICP